MKKFMKLFLFFILTVSLSLTSCFGDDTTSTYTITYNGNSNTGGTVPVDSNSYETGMTFTVLGNTRNLVKTDHVFNNWNTATDGSGTGYTLGQTIIMASSDIILYVNWTTNFTDNMNGTIVEQSTSLVWKKCSQGQVWNSIANDCAGTGSSGDNYGIQEYQFCNVADNSCDNGTILDGTGTSSLWDTCNALNTNPSGGYGGYTNWRVPTADEIEFFFNNTFSITLFPNTVTISEADGHFTSSVYSNTNAYYFSPSRGVKDPDGIKTENNYVRCVAGP
jgi:uncharacterized protein DUF1566